MAAAERWPEGIIQLHNRKKFAAEKVDTQSTLPDELTKPLETRAGKVYHSNSDGCVLTCASSECLIDFRTYTRGISTSAISHHRKSQKASNNRCVPLATNVTSRLCFLFLTARRLSSHAASVIDILDAQPHGHGYDAAAMNVRSWRLTVRQAHSACGPPGVAADRKVNRTSVYLQGPGAVLCRTECPSNGVLRALVKSRRPHMPYGRFAL